MAMQLAFPYSQCQSLGIGPDTKASGRSCVTLNRPNMYFGPPRGTASLPGTATLGPESQYTSAVIAVASKFQEPGRNFSFLVPNFFLLRILEYRQAQLSVLARLGTETVGWLHSLRLTFDAHYGDDKGSISGSQNWAETVHPSSGTVASLFAVCIISHD